MLAGLEWVASERSRGNVTSPDSIVPATKYVGLAQGTQLCDEPGNRAEFYSLMRDGELSEDDGVYRYFDTGAERQRNSE